jgi:hypothetical protein
MARGVFNEFSHYMTHSIRYRYVCEQCGCITQWIPAEITQGSKTVKKIKTFHADKNMLSADKSFKNLEEKTEKQIQTVLDALKKTLSSETCDIIIPDEPFITEIYNETFSAGLACPHCGKRQSWYPASTEPLKPTRSAKYHAIGYTILSIIFGLGLYNLFFTGDMHWSIALTMTPVVMAAVGALYGYFRTKRQIKAKIQYYNNISVKHKPEVDWEDISNDDTAEESSESQENHLDEKYAETYMILDEKSDDNHKIYQQLANHNHINIQGVRTADDGNLIIEDFDGVTLNDKLKSGAELSVLEDYILQLCDGLEFLSQQKPPIAHNAVTPENILIDSDNLLKLINFDQATHNKSTDDIIAVGKILQSFNAKYMKRFKPVIQKCIEGGYITLEKLRYDLYSRKPIQSLYFMIPILFIVIRLSAKFKIAPMLSMFKKMFGM